MTALEVDRGNALPLASIFLLYALTRRRRPSTALPPSPFPLSLVGSIKALLDSGIIAFLVCSSKTRKRLVFSVDRSFSRLSARGIVVSRELIKQIPYRANTALLLKRDSLPLFSFSRSRSVSYPSPFLHRTCVPCILTHARTHTRNVYVFMHVHTRMHEYHVSHSPLPFPFSFPRSLIPLPLTKGSRRLLCDYLKTYFFYNDNDNNNKLMRSEETFY